MRSYFLVFIAFCYSGNAQTKRVELKIKTDDKISIHGFIYWQQLQITSEDTSFIYQLHTKKPNITLNLKQGNYTVTVSSVFNTRVSKKVSLQKKSTCLKFTGLPMVYHQATDSKNLTEKIKLHDTLYIIYSTTKEGVSSEKLAITKTDNGLEALLYDGLTNTLLNKMLFNPNSFKYVTEFETNLKAKNAPKAETATIKEIYTIELNKEISTFIIPQNNDGIEKLKAILFIVQR
ncbi:MAG: hypothetical protein ABI448_09440 [Bacteroidia bacterium]